MRARRSRARWRCAWGGADAWSDAGFSVRDDDVDRGDEKHEDDVNLNSKPIVLRGGNLIVVRRSQSENSCDNQADRGGDE